MLEKKRLSVADLEAHEAMELPDREMMALVNIIIVDTLSGNNVNVQVPIGVAANVCGVQANLLAQNNIREPVDCTAATTQELPVRFR